eukprot:7790221-Pyramimonas_sp.AAC.1
MGRAPPSALGMKTMGVTCPLIEAGSSSKADRMSIKRSCSATGSRRSWRGCRLSQPNPTDGP